MNLTEIGKEFDPKDILDIDLENSIIACVTENNSNLIYDNKSIYFSNPTDVSFNRHKILNNNFTVFNYDPKVKWSIPNNIVLRYQESSKHEIEYFSTIYKNIVFQKLCTENMLISHSFNIFIDRERSRQISRIKKNETLLEINIDYKIFAEKSVDNFYIIQNNYCFQEFEKHFNK